MTAAARSDTRSTRFILFASPFVVRRGSQSMGSLRHISLLRLPHVRNAWSHRACGGMTPMGGQQFRSG